MSIMSDNSPGYDNVFLIQAQAQPNVELIRYTNRENLKLGLL